jgi:hypothetical protein
MALLIRSCLLGLLFSRAYAHSQAPLSDTSGWAAYHMSGNLGEFHAPPLTNKEEHGIQGFDAATFFTLHDFSTTGHWSSVDIERFYGLAHDSNTHVDDDKRRTVSREILDLFDADGDARVSRDEFVGAWARGVRLPDLGLGPGHHGDAEQEYETHHWNKYHGDDTKVEDLTHPEDIEHFRKHEQQEAEEARMVEQAKLEIVEANIPAKYLRNEL